MSDYGQTGKPRGRWFTIFCLAFGAVVFAVLAVATVWQGNVHDSDSSAAQAHATRANFLEEASTEAGIAAPLLRKYVETGDATLIPQIDQHAKAAIQSLTGALGESGVVDLAATAAEGGRLAESLGQVIALRQSGDVAGAAAALEQLTPTFDKVVTQVTDAATLEDQEAASLRGSADSANDAAAWLLIASIAWGVLLAVGVAAVIIRSTFGRRVSKTPSTI